MKAVQISSFGAPADVLEIVEVETPTPQTGQVVVDLEAAPINPSDLMLIEGHYAVHPPLPADAGAEGVGRISAVGAGVDPARIGERVLVVPTLRHGTWREQTLVAVNDVVTINGEGDVLQQAMIGINPITADLLLDYADLKAGDWVAQTAANSAVGAYLIALAKQAGLRTLNIVRREGAAQEVLAAGGDVAIVSDNNFVDTLGQTLGGERIPLLLTPIGGEVISQTAPFLAHGAKVVGYAAINGAPVIIPPQYLTFGDITVRGFWLNNWLKSTPVKQIAARYQRIAQLTDEGTLAAPVAATYPIDQIGAAIEHASRDGHAGRQGKVLLTFGSQARA